MKAFAPNGLPILGTLENVGARADIKHFSRDPDGSLSWEYSGDTKVWWEEMYTVERDGEAVFVDEEGTEWKKGELELRDE